MAPLRAVFDKKAATRDAYGEALADLGAVNPRIVALDGDLLKSTKMDKFAERFPDRFFQIGISEADLIGTAAGLAHAGFIPFVSSFAVFATGRCFDQIRQSVCYSDNRVKIAATHAGLQPGPDGATHQATEDIALMRALPGMTVVVPADAVETRKAVFAAAEWDGPVYLRLGRGPWPVLFEENYLFTIGRAVRLREGDDITLIACGIMVSLALQAAEMLSQQGIQACVLNMSTLKPIDEEAIVASARETGAIVTAEEHQISGGLGEAVARVVATHWPVPMGFVALADTFGESGDPDQLMLKYGLSAERITVEAAQVLKRKQRSG